MVPIKKGRINKPLILQQYRFFKAQKLQLFVYFLKTNYLFLGHLRVVLDFVLLVFAAQIVQIGEVVVFLQIAVPVVVPQVLVLHVPVGRLREKLQRIGIGVLDPVALLELLTSQFV